MVDYPLDAGKEELATGDPAAPTPAELEAGRLLFAGQCDFIAAANNLNILPPISRPEIAFAGR